MRSASFLPASHFCGTIVANKICALLVLTKKIENHSSKCIVRLSKECGDDFIRYYSEAQLARLSCADGVYSNPADAEVLDNLDGVSGTAILCNDLAADLENGSALTLAGA